MTTMHRELDRRVRRDPGTARAFPHRMTAVIPRATRAVTYGSAQEGARPSSEEPHRHDRASRHEQLGTRRRNAFPTRKSSDRGPDNGVAAQPRAARGFRGDLDLRRARLVVSNAVVGNARTVSLVCTAWLLDG